MNKDIRLSTGFWQHPKTKRTIKKLGLEGIQSLQILWLWVAINRPDGNLSGMDWEDIELAADWNGEEKAFFNFCTGEGSSPLWIDTTADGEFILHDWVEHNPWQAEAEERSNASRFVNLAKVNKPIYEILKKQGTKGITKEEFERYKNEMVRTNPVQTNTVSPLDTAQESKAPSFDFPQEIEALPVGNARDTVTKRPSPSPSPSPQPKEKNTQHTYLSSTSHACDYTKSKRHVYASENTAGSLQGACNQEDRFSFLATTDKKSSALLDAYERKKTSGSLPSASIQKTVSTASGRVYEKERLSGAYQDRALAHNGNFQNKNPSKRISPSKETPEWSNFLSCYEVYPVQKNQESAWKVWYELSQHGVLDPTAYIRDKIIEMKTYDSQWVAGYAPYMENWLKNKGWNDKPHIKPDPKQQEPRFLGVAKTPEQLAQEKREAEAFLARKREESRKENAKILERRRQEENKKKQRSEQGSPPNVILETEKKEA